MRLLNLTNRYYIIVALALLLVSSAFLAYRVLYVVDEEITMHMLYTRLQLEKQIASQPQLQGRPFFVGDYISVDTISRFTSFRVDIRDTLRYDPYEEGKVPFRVMTYEQQIAGKPYRISIAQRLTQNNDLFNGLGSTFILVIVDIFVCFYFLNRYFSTSIWRPFYRALDTLKRFDIQRGGKVRFEKSRVDEFNVLNEELGKLTDKVMDDYRNLREFTENMSHETQTPLAVIRSKLELLLQSDNLKAEQMEQVSATLDAVNRLSKMNRGLILLTRIDNEQYSEEAEIDFSRAVRKQLDDLMIFAQSRHLEVKTDFDDTLTVILNPYLNDILISNLLSNAIKYCTEGGTISISTTDGVYRVANSGAPLKFPDNRIFERFKKRDAADSVGLGLAIVKRIGDHYDMAVSYQYMSGMHVFSVKMA
ncbi:MAG: sensor histidine kinase [Bacteroidota bacterium]